MEIGSNKKVGNVVQQVSENIGSAVMEEFGNLKNVLNSDGTVTEKLYAGVTFIDPQAWAEKHPEAVKPVTVAVLGAVGAACPATIPVATLIGILPADVCTFILDWGNRPCPPYILRQVLKKKMKNIPEEEKLILFENELETSELSVAEAV